MVEVNIMDVALSKVQLLNDRCAPLRINPGHIKHSFCQEDSSYLRLRTQYSLKTNERKKYKQKDIR